MIEHTEQDRRVAERQLGRPLRGRWSVAARCHLGVPMVIENHPRLDDGSPFPTLFWLTCPVLVKRVSRLEAEGWMAAINAAMSSDGALAEGLTSAMGRYVERRDALEPIEDSGALPGGGTQRVKCIHVHVAQELADPPNPVGARALARAGWPDCRLPCVDQA